MSKRASNMNSSLSHHREMLCRKLEANFESIIAKYDRPFPNDDEIDLNKLLVTTNKGKLRKLTMAIPFGSTPLSTDDVGGNLSRQESTDSALGSTNYSDSGDVDTSEGSSSSGDEATDSDGSGPSHPSSQRKRYWTKKNRVDRRTPFQSNLTERSHLNEDCYFNTYEQIPYKEKSLCGRHDIEREEYSDIVEFGKVPSILSETNKFVEKVQSFILEGSESSSDESTGIDIDDSDDNTFRSSCVKLTLLSGIWRNNSTRDVNRIDSKQNIMNMTYNVDPCKSMKCRTVSEEPRVVPSNPLNHYGMRCSVSQEPKIMASKPLHDCGMKFSSASLEPQMVSSKPVSSCTMRFRSISEEPKIVSNKPVVVPQKKNIVQSEKECWLKTNVPNSEVVDNKYNNAIDEKQKCTPRKPKLIETKNVKRELSPSSSKLLEDVQTSPAVLRVGTPRAKLYLDPKLTTPATPGCTTEEIIKFLNSPLDVLVENNTRAALKKSSRRHFSFSPKDINKKEDTTNKYDRKWRPQCNSTQLTHIERMEIESMEVDRVIASPTRHTSPSRSCHSVKDQTSQRTPRACLSNSPGLLVSPLGHLNMKSPSYLKNHKIQSCNARVNKNLIIKSECFDEHEKSDDDIIPLVMSDDDTDEEEALMYGTNSLSNKAENLGINKIDVLCKTTKEEQRLISRGNQQSDDEHKVKYTTVEPTKDIKHVNKSEEIEQSNQKQSNIKADVWWLKKPSVQREGTRIIKTAARRSTSNSPTIRRITSNSTATRGPTSSSSPIAKIPTSISTAASRQSSNSLVNRGPTTNNTVTQEINNTYSWFVNRYPDESSFYPNDVGNVSILSTIPLSSPVRCHQSTVPDDYDIVNKSPHKHKLQQKDFYCTPKKKSSGCSSRIPDNVRASTTPAIRALNPPSVQAKSTFTIRTSTPPRIRTSTPPRIRTSTPPRIQTSTPPSVRTSTPRKLQSRSVSNRFQSLAENNPIRKTQINPISGTTRVLRSDGITSPNLKGIADISRIPNSFEVKHDDQDQKSSKWSTRHCPDINDTTTANLSASFSCMGRGVCNKTFCFNCTFS